MYKDLSFTALDLAADQAEQIELALSFGFRGIDVDLVDLQRRVATHGLAKARRLIDSAKIRLSAFELPFHAGDEDSQFRTDLENLKQLGALAAELGCTRAISRLAPASDERPYHENFEFYRRRYNDIAAALAPHGIRLGIAFSADPALRKDRAFEFIHSLDALAMLVSTVAARNVGVVVDLWDLWRAGGTVEDLRKVPVAQLVQLRVADALADVSPDEADTTTRMLPGETGVIDAVGALVMLAESGYDGPITPTPNRGRLGVSNREAVVKQVGQALDKVWKMAGLTPAGKLAQPAKK